jgi:N-acetylneuraminic acid mutarotase
VIVVSGRRRFAQLLVIGALVVLVGFLSLAQGEWAAWETKAPMRNRRALFATAVLEGEIWTIGGYARGFNRGVVEVYNPQKDSWRTMDPFPLPMNGLTAGVVDGKIYVFGGCHWVRYPCETDYTYAYDPRREKWEMRAPMPSKRGWMGSAVVDGKIYVIGGESEPYKASNENAAYDPLSDTWEVKAPMPTARANPAVVAFDGKIYVFGGSVMASDRTDVAIPKVEVYDPVSDTWEERRPMPVAVAGAGAVVVGSKIYLIGGASVICLHTSQNRPVNQVYIYDPATDRWREATPLPTPRAHLGVAFVDNTIYAFGGSTFGCGVTNVNEALYIED